MKRDFKTANFYFAIFLEGIGVAFLVFIIGIAWLRMDVKTEKYIIEVAFIAGITLATLTQSLKDVTGAHLNPAITMASLFTRRVSILRGILYIIFQCAGGILGTFCLREMFTKAKDKHLAMTRLSRDTSIVKGIIYEMVFTFVLTLVYFSSKSSKETFKGFGGPLVIGLFYAVAHIAIIPYTGCSLNPARSLGPAVFMEDFDDHWIYWVGPILAAIFAGLLHDVIFQRFQLTSSSRPKSCNICCCKPSYDDPMFNDFNNYSDEPGSYRGVIIRKGEDDV